MKIYLRYGDNQVEGPITTPEEFHRRSSAIMAEYGEVHMERADLICDFCSWPRIRWKFTIPAAEMPRVSGVPRQMDEDGLWGACDDCKNFIMAEDWRGLLERSVHNATALKTPMAGLPPALIATGVMGAHGHFESLWDRSEPVAMENDADFLNSIGIAEGALWFKGTAGD